ncbi:MAG: hypothetical protein F4Y03_10580 [Alphaproteobacteria bacterium]|nr:hypothetical protein [Alphaproteobacteria bacterium]
MLPVAETTRQCSAFAAGRVPAGADRVIAGAPAGMLEGSVGSLNLVLGPPLPDDRSRALTVARSSSLKAPPIGHHHRIDALEAMAAAPAAGGQAVSEGEYVAADGIPAFELIEVAHRHFGTGRRGGERRVRAGQQRDDGEKTAEAGRGTALRRPSRRFGAGGVSLPGMQERRASRPVRSEIPPPGIDVRSHCEKPSEARRRARRRTQRSMC